MEEFAVDNLPEKMVIIKERNDKLSVQNSRNVANPSRYSQPIANYNQTYVQPPYYQPIQPASSIYNYPISNYTPSTIQYPISNIQGGGYEGSLTYSQPNSSYIPSSYYNGVKPLSTGEVPNNYDIHKFTLSKID